MEFANSTINNCSNAIGLFQSRAVKVPLWVFIIFLHVLLLINQTLIARKHDFRVTVII